MVGTVKRKAAEKKRCGQGEKGKKPSSLPIPFFRRKARKWGKEKEVPYPLSLIPLPFFLPPYPLPLSTNATQARQNFAGNHYIHGLNENRL